MSSLCNGGPAGAGAREAGRRGQNYTWPHRPRCYNRPYRLTSNPYFPLYFEVLDYPEIS